MLQARAQPLAAGQRTTAVPRVARGPARGCKASRKNAVVVKASQEYETLRGQFAYRASSGDPVEILSLWEAFPSTKVVVPCLTHFADLTSWEYAQKLNKVIPLLESSGVKVVVLGLGSVSNAQEFARVLKFPLDRLYALPEGGPLYQSLGFSPGFAKDLDISPYVKLLPMLAGIGSPGTLQEVIRGYIGDQSAKPVFDSPTPFDILGTGYQRPFELATLRLFNMMGILPKWSELSPPDTQLLTQQGGTIIFEGTNVVFKHVDSGILRYTDVDAVVQAALAADYTAAPTALEPTTRP